MARRKNKTVRIGGAIFGAILATVFSASISRADTMVQVASISAQNANDTVNWSQLGVDATSLGSSFGATSVGGLSGTVTLAGTGSLVSVVCPASPCSWVGTGFNADDSLIWTSDLGNSGNGPLSFGVSTSVSGVGALIQADGPTQFTAQIQVFNGATSLGSFSATSNTNGDATYLGVIDQSGANISSAVFSITSCEGACSDFAIDTLNLNSGPPGSPIPTATATATATGTSAATATATKTATATATATATKTATPTATATATRTATATATASATASQTATATATPTATATSTRTATATATATQTATPTATNTATATSTATATPTLTATQTATETATATVTPTPITLTVAPASFSIPNTKFGAKVVKTVQVSNKQKVKVSLSHSISGTNAADFKVSGGTCTRTLAAKTSCTMQVTYKPGVLGIESATLTVSDSPDPNSPYDDAFNVAGTIPEGVSPLTLSYGSVSRSSSKTLKTTVTNKSPFTISIGSAVSGANAADFTITGGTCGESLAGNSSCTIGVKFKPTTTKESATLGVTVPQDPTSPRDVKLTGTGS